MSTRGPHDPYDHKHRRQRRILIPRALGTWCPVGGLKCDGLMTDPTRMDIGHILAVVLGGTDDIQNKRVECSTCNRGAGGVLGNRLKSRRASRDW
jgi:hypothetical protein